MSSLEKDSKLDGSVEEVEVRRTADGVDLEAASQLERRAKIEKRVLRKMDLRILVLTLIYILNYIDRNNASAARLQGFQQDLHLTDQQYATVLSILFVGYILMQVPSNMLLHWISRPSLYLPCSMMVWGLISVLTGITQNYVGAVLCRFFVGFVEATYLCGAFYLISRWYKREEIALRTTIVYCGSLISNGWGALIASGILAKMQGVLGKPLISRWLFYIEGSITIFVSICAVFIIPDYPHNDRWLTPEEREIMVSRLDEDIAKDGLTAEDLTVTPFQGLRMAVTDWHVWLLAFAALAQLLAQSFFQYFPTLSATMGYDTTISLVLCAPPWMFATVFAFFYSRHSDKKKKRFIYILWSELAGIIGFVIALSTMNTGARYVSLFLMAQTYAGLIIFYTWMSNSVPRPPAKRAVSLALINAFSQLGNVSGSYIWPSTWGPSYRFSYAICISSAGVHIALCYGMHLALKAQNRTIIAEEQGLEPEKKSGMPKGFRYLE